MNNALMQLEIFAQGHQLAFAPKGLVLLVLFLLLIQVHTLLINI